MDIVIRWPLRSLLTQANLWLYIGDFNSNNNIPSSNTTTQQRWKKVITFPQKDVAVHDKAKNYQDQWERALTILSNKRDSNFANGPKHTGCVWIYIFFTCKRQHNSNPFITAVCCHMKVDSATCSCCVLCCSITWMLLNNMACQVCCFCRFQNYKNSKGNSFTIHFSLLFWIKLKTKLSDSYQIRLNRTLFYA